MQWNTDSDAMSFSHRYLENRFPDHGQRLLPEDPLQRYRVRLICLSAR